MQTSQDQDDGLSTLVENIRSGAKVSTLAGPAGSGKTTLMRILAERLREDGWFVFWAAPTGKAASRLSDIVGESVSTTHALLYTRVREGSQGQPLFGGRREKLLDGRRGLLVVDEASMVGKKIYEDLLLAAGTSVQLLFVGDPEQIPAVASDVGPDLENPTTQLTTVHRQALESPILLVATEVRLGQRMRRESIGDAYVRSRGSAVDAARFIVESLRTGQDSVVICCRNSARRGINRLARIELGFEEDSICKGEQLVVLLNNKAVGKMNGETIRVDAVSVVCDDEGNDSRLLRVHSDGEVYFVHADSIGAEIGDFKRARAKLAHVRNPEQFLHVDYGYALTPWKAQGSEWDNVCFVLDNWLKWLAGKKPIEAKKIVYTTLTRAKKTVLVLEV